MALKTRVLQLERSVARAGEGCVRCAGDSEVKVWLQFAGDPMPPVRTCSRCGRDITMMVVIRKYEAPPRGEAGRA